MIGILKMKLGTSLSRLFRQTACLAILIDLVLSTSGAFNDPMPVPNGAHVALTFASGTNFILGDVIEMTFTLSNAGAESFKYVTGGDYRGTGFPTRYKFTVADEKGTKLA